MPISRYQIRNEYSLAAPELYQSADRDDPEAILEGVAMAGLVGVLRQLGDLAEFAAEIFHDLHEEVMATAARGHALMIRVQQVEAEFPSVEKALLSRTSHSHFTQNAGVDWHANLQLDQNLITSGDLPRFIMDSYEECRGPPRLFSLDKFDVAGAGACLKRYTDPSFYKTELACSKKPKAEIQRETKARKIKKKGARWRNGDTPEIFSTSHFNSILNQLASDDNNRISEKVPIHGVKLKRRHLNGSSFNSRTGRSYMEHILETDPPKHDILLQDSLHDTHELAPTMCEITMEYLSSKQLQLVRTQISGPDRQEVLESSLDEFEQDIIKERTLKSVPEEIPEVELEKIPSTFHQTGKNDTLIDVASKNKVEEFGVEKIPISRYQMKREDELINGDCKMAVDANGYGHDENEVEKIASPLVKQVEKDSVVDSKRKRAVSSDGHGSVESEAEKIHSTFYPVDQKSMLLDAGRKIEASDDGYGSGDATSEMENFMDALTTMESELETDTETRAKHERSFFHVASQGMDSDTNEEHRYLPVQCSDDCLVGNCGTLCDWNSSYKKQRTSSSDMDTLGNSADMQMPKGKEIASFHMHEKSRNSFKLEGALSGSSYDDPLFMSADKSTNGDAAAEAYLSTNALLAEIHDKSPEKLTSSCGGLGTEPPDYLVPTKTGNEVSISPYLVSELVEASSSPFITDEVATIIHSSPRARFHDIPLVGTDVTEISSPKTEETVDDVLQATDITNLPSRTTNDTLLEEVTEGDDKDSAAENVAEETQDSPDLKTFQMEENLLNSVNQDLDACTDSKLTPECLASDVNPSGARQDCLLVEMESGILPIEPLDFQKAGDIVEHEHQKISSRALHESESFDADSSESHVADLAEAPTARPGMLSVEPEELFDSLEHGVTDGTDDIPSGPTVPDSLVNVLPAEVPTNPNDLESRSNNATSESVIHGPTTIFPEASDHPVQLQNASLSASDHHKLESIESKENHIGLDDQGIAAFGLLDNHASQTVVGPTGPIAEPCNSDSTEPVSSEWDDHGLVVVSLQASDDHVQLQEECLARKSSSDHQKLEINESQGNHIGLDDQRITVFGLSDNNANQAVVGPADPNTEPYNPDSTEPVSSGCDDCSPVLVSPEVSNNHEQVQEEYLSGKTASDHHELAIIGSQENHIEFDDQQITVFGLSDNDAKQAVVGPRDPIAESYNPDSTEPVSSECDDQSRAAASPQASDNHEQVQEEFLSGEKASDHHELAITGSQENHIEFDDQRITVFGLSDNHANQAVVGPRDPIAESHNPDSTEPVSSECDDQGRAAASPQASDNHEQVQEEFLSSEKASDHHELAITGSQENHIEFDDQRITVFGLSDNDANQAVVGPTDPIAESHNPDSTEPVSSECDDQGRAAASPQASDNHEQVQEEFLSMEKDSDHHELAITGSQENHIEFDDQWITVFGLSDNDANQAVVGPTDPIAEPHNPDSTEPVSSECDDQGPVAASPEAYDNHEQLQEVSLSGETASDHRGLATTESQENRIGFDGQRITVFGLSEHDANQAVVGPTDPTAEPCNPESAGPVSSEFVNHAHHPVSFVGTQVDPNAGSDSSTSFMGGDQELEQKLCDQVLQPKAPEHTHPCESVKDATSPSTCFLPEPTVALDQGCKLEDREEIDAVSSHEEEQGLECFNFLFEREQSLKEMDHQVLEPFSPDQSHHHEDEKDAASSSIHFLPEPVVPQEQSHELESREKLNLVSLHEEEQGLEYSELHFERTLSVNEIDSQVLELKSLDRTEPCENEKDASSPSTHFLPEPVPLEQSCELEAGIELNMVCSHQEEEACGSFDSQSERDQSPKEMDTPLACEDNHLNVLEYSSVDHLGLQPSESKVQPESHLVVTSGMINGSGVTSANSPVCTSSNPEAHIKLPADDNCEAFESPLSSFDSNISAASSQICPSIDPLVPVATHEMSCKLQLSRPILGFPLTSPNLLNGDLVDMPPLPPLPPLEWRIGKLRHGSVSFGGENTHPMNPFLPPHRTEDENPQQPISSFLPLLTVEERQPQQPLNPSGPLPTTEDEKTQHVSLTLGCAMEPLKTVPLVQTKEDEKPQHASQTLAASGTLPLQTVEDYQPQQLLNPFGLLPTTEDEKTQNVSPALRCEIVQPLKTIPPVQTKEDEKHQHASQSLGGEMERPLKSATVLPIVEDGKSKEDEKRQHASHSVEGEMEQPLKSATALPIVEVEKPKEDEKPQYASQSLGGEMEQPLKSSTALPIVEDGKPQHGLFRFDGLLGEPLNPFIPPQAAEEEKPNESIKSVLNRPRNPLIDAVAAHDRSMLRKASERIWPEIKPKPDERDSLLEQIRTKSFNLKPAASAKPVIQGPKTNLNVVAILEKANAIRQAFAGSDEDDDSDAWSDS